MSHLQQSAHFEMTMLDELSSLVSEFNFDAFVVPSGDPHGSEYVSDAFKRREFLTGFTGSAGTAVVLAGKDDSAVQALLWTDGRYWLQAARQLSAGWQLMKDVQNTSNRQENPSLSEWLRFTLPAGARTGIDGSVISVAGFKNLRDELQKDSIDLVMLEDTSRNPVDEIWGAKRPSLPAAPIRIHPPNLSYSVQDKMAAIQEQMIGVNASHLLVSRLDEVCWLLNIRGQDVPFCPVVLAYVLVSLNNDQLEITLFIDEHKIKQANIQDYFRDCGVQVLPYETIFDRIRNLDTNADARLWMDPNSTSALLWRLAGGDDPRRNLIQASPIPLMKACKAEEELDGLRQAHIKDGVALVEFLSWLDSQFQQNEDFAISEFEASEVLESFRKKQDGYLSCSFETISAFGSNGSIIHYKPEKDDCRLIDRSQLFLLDSGGQYVEGTTDVTRTMHFGTPSDYERECFTRVLKGKAAMERVIFPEGVLGTQLDTLARQYLWQVGRNYGHGTGHGVGAALCVHEGPQTIGPRVSTNPIGIFQGMVVSNEPGYYEDNKFGIRIECVQIAVEACPTLFNYQSGNNKYLTFENITLVPISRNLIEPSLMTKDEIHWFNAYHSKVYGVLSPHLSAEDQRWLRHATLPL